MTRFSSLSEWEWQICVIATGLQGKVTQTLQWGMRFKWCEKSGKHDSTWAVTFEQSVNEQGHRDGVGRQAFQILDRRKCMHESRRVYNMYLSFLWFKYSWILINYNWLMWPHGASVEHLPARQFLVYGDWSYFLYIQSAAQTLQRQVPQVMSRWM